VTQALVVYFGLILARVGTFVAVMPLVAGRTPRTVRVGLAFALAVHYFAAVRPGWDARIAGGVSDVVYAAALLREGVIGVVIGLMFSLFLLPARVAGEFVSHQIGLALSPLPGPTADGQATIIPMLFEVMASLLFLGLDGHHVALATLHASFAKLPLGGGLVALPPGPVLDGLASCHEMGILLAAPLAVCLFLLSIGLALAARAAPQLNIYSVGFTLQVVVALLGLLFLLPDLVQSMSVCLQRVAAAVQAWAG
jgi:flagellar biosynthetic protein FliR